MAKGEIIDEVNPIHIEAGNHVQRALMFFMKERNISLASSEVGALFAMLAGEAFGMGKHQMDQSLGMINMNAVRGFELGRKIKAAKDEPEQEGAGDEHD